MALPFLWRATVELFDNTRGHSAVSIRRFGRRRTVPRHETKVAEGHNRSTCVNGETRVPPIRIVCLYCLKRRNRPGGMKMCTLRKLALAGLVLGLLASPASTQTVKVGIILTYSGADLNLGAQIDRGLRLYMKEHEKDLPAGVKLELVVKDDGGPNPDAAKRMAQELIVRDKVNVIAGLVWTPNAAAIAPMVTEAKVPLVLMNAASSGLPRLSPYIVRVSYTLWQFAYPMGEWAAGQGAKTA